MVPWPAAAIARPRATTRRIPASPPMPATWLPWPGKQRAIWGAGIEAVLTPPVRLLGDDDLAPVVRAAVGAYVVGPAEPAALGARRQRRTLKSQVRASSVAARLGDALLGDCHSASDGERCYARGGCGRPRRPRDVGPPRGGAGWRVYPGPRGGPAR